MARQKRSVFNEINITPLTDIFLVLLIIMMVIAPLLDSTGLSLVVPENVEEKQALENETKILTVTIDDQDNYFVGEEAVLPDDLSKVIAKNAKEFPGGVMIEVSEGTTHGAMVKVMDEARSAGVSSISVSEK